MHKYWGMDPLPVLRSAMAQAAAQSQQVAAAINAHSHGSHVRYPFLQRQCCMLMMLMYWH